VKILSIDYGAARTGIAICDRTELLASPAGVINEKNQAALIQRIIQAARANEAELIIVGLPRNMDGSEGESAITAQKLAEQIQKSSGIPVQLWDERRTTISAHNILNEANVRGKKRKAVVDAVAAVIILENYLAYKKNGEKV